MSDIELLRMAREKDSLDEKLSLRIPGNIKTDLLGIDPEYTRPAREAIIQYIPIKKLMSNPLALPRNIGKKDTEIIFSVSDDGKFQVCINGKHTTIETDDLRIFMANIYLYTLNADKI